MQALVTRRCNTMNSSGVLYVKLTIGLVCEIRLALCETLSPYTENF